MQEVSEMNTSLCVSAYLQDMARAMKKMPSKKRTQKFVAQQVQNIIRGRKIIKNVLSKVPLITGRYFLDEFTSLLNGDGENTIYDGDKESFNNVIDQYVHAVKLHKNVVDTKRLYDTVRTQDNKKQYYTAVARFNLHLKKLPISPQFYNNVVDDLITIIIQYKKLEHQLQLSDQETQQKQEYETLLSEILTKLDTMMERIHEGKSLIKKARDEIVKANLPLVLYVAKRYINKGVLLGDLIQEGNMGLMKAIDKYSLDLQYHFTTYATIWIRQHIQRAIENTSKPIRMPSYLYDMDNKIRKTSSEFYSIHERMPTDEELADILKEPVSKIRKITKESYMFLSLDEQLTQDVDNPGNDATLYNVLESDAFEDPETVAIKNSLPEKLTEVMAKVLNEREREVLYYRYGLTDGVCHTLEETGNMLNLTRERVRQIEKAALSKLRSKSSFNTLKEYLH